MRKMRQERISWRRFLECSRLKEMLKRVLKAAGRKGGRTQNISYGNYIAIDVQMNEWMDAWVSGLVE